MNDEKYSDILPSGAIDKPDKRDYLAEHILGDAEDNIPERVMFSIKEGNQGAQRATKVACTCFAPYHVAQALNEKEHETSITPNFLEGWGKQGKFGTRVANGDYVQTGLKSIVKNGLITQEGERYEIEGYAYVARCNIKQWLAKGYPIVTSANVTSTNFKKAKNNGVWGGNDGGRITGHAFCLVGYEPGYVIASNSYGSIWGKYKDGTFKIKESDLQHLGSCYALYDKQDVKYLYKDVTDHSPCYTAIKLMGELGLMTGYDDGRFGPNDSMTRSQMAVVIERLIKYLGK